MRFLIPEQVETERLMLRTFVEEDWKDLFEYYSDPECMKYTAGRALTDWETWRSVATMVGHWQLRNYGPYAMELKESKKVIGPVGLWYTLEWPEPEVKWGLARSAWGKGYAKEAAQAVLQTAKEYLPEFKLMSLISFENTKSVKLAESLGATYEKTIPFRGKDNAAHIYRHKHS